MAKDRHRVFEIYPSLDEAAWELMPKAQNAGTPVVASGPWSLKSLSVSHSLGITQVGFNEAELDAPEIVAQLQEDFTQLAEKLSGNSRVLIDFTGVQMFSTAGINALITFNKKLKARGSRMILCCLGPNVRASFFTPDSEMTKEYP